MKHKKILPVLTAIILIAAFFLPEDSRAIPAFARRYKISCSACHAPFPKLKEYGAEFAGNGFILKEEEKERDYVTAGDPLLWLNRTFPVGIRFDAYAMYDQGKTVDKDLQTPWGLKILSGGALYKNIGYYFYFYMSERGEVAGIEDAYIHFDNVLGSELDILVGQFQTSDPLMKRELRLTFEDYEIYKHRTGMSNTNLAYDRGVMFLYGIPATGTDFVAMVVNGNGKTEADAERKFDQDKYKNFGFRIAQGIGRYLSVGGFYYTGRENELWTNADNKVTYWGPDAHIGAGPVEVTVQYLERKDSNPYFNSGAEEVSTWGPVNVKTRGIVAEMILSPKLDRSRYYITALYNRIGFESYKIYETATLGVTYLVARNLRLTAEYTRDLVYDKNRFVIGTVSGF